MKKKDTPEARKFWALAEETAKLVKTWPQWQQDFAAGYGSQTREPASEAYLPEKEGEEGE